MKKVLLVLTCFAMTACHQGVDGVLTVNSGSTVQLKDKSGNLVTLAPGNANVVMKPGSITISVPTQVGTTTKKAGKNDTIILTGPNDSLPGWETSGEHDFSDSAAQPYVNIQEITLNTVNESNPRDGWEPCTVVVPMEVPCPPPVEVRPPGDQGPGQGPGGRPPGGGQPGQPPQHGGRDHASFTAVPRRGLANIGCTAERAIQGHQHITYHYRGDAFEVQLIIKDKTNGATLASFDGFDTSSDRIIDQYFGGCDLTPGFPGIVR